MTFAKIRVFIFDAVVKSFKGAFGFCTLVAFLISQNSWAFFRDPLYVNVTTMTRLGENVLEVGAGPPPIRLGKTLWINAISYKSYENSPDIIFNQKVLSPQSTSYVRIFKDRLNEKWDLTYGGSLSSRHAGKSFRVTSDSTFWNAFLLFNRSFGVDSQSTWSIGLVAFDASSRFRLIPGFGLNYISDSGNHRYLFAYPRTGYVYRLNPSTFLGALVSYESNAFVLPLENQSSSPFEKGYLAIERFSSGLLFRKALHRQNLWLNTRLSYIFWGEKSYLPKNNIRGEGQRIAIERGLSFTLGLSYVFGKG